MEPTTRQIHGIYREAYALGRANAGTVDDTVEAAELLDSRGDASLNGI